MKPLDGIKVIEVAQGMFVPAAGALLGDWGADIIKIEHPKGGDGNRGILGAGSRGAVPWSRVNFAFEHPNRNKRSIAVDLNRPEGRNVLCQLVEKSDVLITNFLQSARRRLKIDYDDLAPLNSRLVYVRGTGYGEKGPEANRAGYDYAAFWARGGIAASLGEPDSPPPTSRPAMGDSTGAIFTAAAALAGLLAREKTGEGQVLDVSLLSAAIWVNALDILAATTENKRLPRLSRTEAGNPLWNTYQARDGRWIQLVMLQSDRYWSAFCRAIDRTELEKDPRFSNHENRCDNNKLLIKILDDTFIQRTAKEWADVLDKYGEVLWTLMQETVDLANDPQVRENGYLLDVRHPTHGAIKAVASPIKFSKTPTEIRSFAPELGQHTEEVLLELGYTWEGIGKFKENGVIL